MTPMDGSPAHDPGSIDDELSDDLRARVKAELEPGERLLWSARPFVRQEGLSGKFVAGVLIAIVLSVVGGVSWSRVYWNPLGEVSGPLFFGCCLGLVDFFLVLGLVWNRFEKRSERARKANTLYALTDRRAIIWSPVPSPNRGAFRVDTIPRGGFAAVHRVEFPDGSGDVVFRDRVVGADFEVFSSLGFYGIAEVRRVEEQVRRTLIESAAPPTSI